MVVDDPTAPYGQPATAQMEILINRLLDMVTESVEEASAPNKPLDEEAKAKMKELEALTATPSTTTAAAATAAATTGYVVVAPAGGLLRLYCESCHKIVWER